MGRDLTTIYDALSTLPTFPLSTHLKLSISSRDSLIHPPLDLPTNDPTRFRYRPKLDILRTKLDLPLLPDLGRLDYAEAEFAEEGERSGIGGRDLDEKGGRVEGQGWGGGVLETGTKGR